jgi:hypothetical protein
VQGDAEALVGTSEKKQEDSQAGPVWLGLFCALLAAKTGILGIAPSENDKKENLSLCKSTRLIRYYI